jgi:hypothetical protein
MWGIKLGMRLPKRMDRGGYEERLEDHVSNCHRRAIEVILVELQNGKGEARKCTEVT